MKRLFLLLLFLAVSRTAEAGFMLAPVQSFPYVPEFYDGASVGNLDSSANWQEISGVAHPSLPANAGYLWVISDSPANMLGAVSITNASNQGEWTLTSHPAYSDWEDVATANINGQAYIYVADFGDNGNARATFTIFRCKEPAITGSNGAIAAVDYESIVCEYPAGNLPTHKDAETLLVDPDTGDMYIITKRETVPHVYKLAHAASYSGTQTTQYLGAMYDIPDASSTAASGNAVGGDISPNGNEILIKSYDVLYHWARPDKTVSIYTTLQNTPTVINAYTGGGNTTTTYLKRSHPSAEPQGEGVTWDYAGLNIYTASEYVATEGSSSVRYPLFKYVRAAKIATSISFQDGVAPTAGYTGTSDTYIWDTNPSTDNGAATSIIADTAVAVESDQRKVLLKWDISSLASTAVVIGSQVDLYVNTEGQGWKFHKMLVTWTESSTYNSLTTGVDNDGVDAAVAEDCRNGVNLDTLTGLTRNNVAYATVQSWVQNSATNYGYLIEATDLATGDGEQFDSKQGATAARHPKLTVRYV